MIKCPDLLGHLVCNQLPYVTESTNLDHKTRRFKSNEAITWVVECCRQLHCLEQSTVWVSHSLKETPNDRFLHSSS